MLGHPLSDQRRRYLLGGTKRLTRKSWREWQVPAAILNAAHALKTPIESIVPIARVNGLPSMIIYAFPRPPWVNRPLEIGGGFWGLDPLHLRERDDAA